MSATTSLPRSIEMISPFRHSSESRAAIPARVSGKIPFWLRGEVLRTCPVVFDMQGWHAQHWFDGLGMIYAFRIKDSAIDFRSRLLDSESARHVSRGKADLVTFGTPTTRGLLQRILAPVPRGSDNTNVNIVKLGKELVALTEGDRQHVIDDETLASVGTVDYGKGALHRAIMTPHPHFDFERARVVNVATEFGASGVISIYEHAPAARKREVVGSWRTKRVPYVHGFGLTPRNAILIAHPFTVTPLRMLFSNRGFIDHFHWNPEEGTRLVVMDRATGAVREHVTDPFFVFHTVNAFERGGETILDVLAYPDAGIVRALRVDRMIEQLPDLRPSLVRIVMRPGSERASSEKLSDLGFEFPSTNYKLVNGQPYRFAWGASNGPRAGGTYASAIVKVDLQTGSSASFSDDIHIFGEPLFVSRPQGDGEDDGVLLSVGSAKDAETSVLAVIDAKSMDLLATAEVPSSIPLGFHGSFQRQ
ncbi:MAG TPA: carotenoid oxygenase family protein [Thermoanaerobaculia bacterium]|jgi:carotenoid cleavage dioxygenase-like enzyme|nr:carotenoid oxygenase family protein [Thermoanaerobaculia bacterium]